MQITRVELRNIKNHAQAEWHFFPGLIAICGPNGSGKTTILEAIAWTLFDQLEYRREDFVRRGQLKGSATVSFISDLDEREYNVYRDTAAGYYCTDAVTGMRLVEQKNNVLPWLCRHIGVEPGTDLPLLFRSTIGVPQGTFTLDFARRAAERKRIFDHTLKVDEYAYASDRLRQTARYVDDEAAGVRLKIASAEGELRVYDQNQLDLARANEREKRLASSLDAAALQQKHLTAEMTRLDELQRRLATERNAAETLEVKLRLTRDQLSTALESAEQARLAAALVADAREAHDRYLAASNELNELEQQRSVRDRIRNLLALLEKRQIELNSQYAHYADLLEQVETRQSQLPEIDELIRQQLESESRIAALREARGARESDRREVERLDRELETLRKQYADTSRTLAHCEAQQPLAQRLPELQRELLEVSTILSTRDALTQNIETREEQAQSLIREAERLTKEQKQRHIAINELGGLRDTAVDLESRSAALSKETARLARLRAEIERDVAMIGGLEGGGICPLLSEKCLNLSPGESLDGRFQENVTRRREEVSEVEQIVTRLGAEVHLAQEATARMRALPALLSEFDRVSETIQRNLDLAATIHKEVKEKREALRERASYASARLPAIQIEVTEAQQAQELSQQVQSLHRTIEALKDRGTELGRERSERALRLDESVDSDATLSQEEDSLRALGDPRSRRREIERQIDQASAWKTMLTKLAGDLRTVDDEIAKVSAGLVEFASLEDVLETRRSERAAHESKYRSFIANQQTAATLPAREADVARFTSELDSAEHALAAINESVVAIKASYDTELHLEVRAKLEESTRLTIQLSTQLDHTREEIRERTATLARLGEVRAAMNTDQARYDGLRNLHETTEFIRSTLLQAAPFITEAYLFSISHEANQLYREISGRQDVSLGWTREYEITLEEEGQKRPFSSLSGGEQMAAALAFRLALLKELSAINIAFFDEPTANLDEDRRRNLAQQIGRIKHFNQLFVVSHDDSFEAYTDQVIILTERQSIETPSGAS